MGAPTGKMDIQELRTQAHVVIPNGVEKIESGWFKDSKIRSVEIPASVRVIES